ncbi:MAG: hypothetical protein ABL966_08275 [Acidimicrobiales bacterium]
MEIDVPEYSPAGLPFVWDDEAQISVSMDPTFATVSANRDGLVTLARHLLTLAQPSVPIGNHFELDDLNGFEEGSLGLRVVLVDGA